MSSCVALPSGTTSRYSHEVSSNRNESVISMFFMVVRYCLEVELEPEVERPLERIAQSVARTFFGVPVFEW